MPVYRAAIIGLGRMGSTIDDEMPPGSPSLPYAIASAVRAIPRLTLVAGADLLPEKREAFRSRWGVEAVYADYRQMIAETKPDLVAITTRAENHAELTVAVAEMGVRMIFCEKAIACSMREADAVLQGCQARGVHLNTGVLRRFSPGYQRAREVIASGAIGEARVGLFGDFRHPIMHNGIHTVDTLMYLMGDPRAAAVRGRLKDVTIEGNRLDKDPDTAFYHVEFAGGAEAFLVPGGAFDFHIIGTRGELSIENNGSAFRLRQAAETGANRSPWAEAPFPPFQPGSGTVRCLTDLVDAFEQGRPTLGDAEVCHHATEICLGIVESHRQGGARVELPLQNRDLYVWHV